MKKIFKIIIFSISIILIGCVFKLSQSKSLLVVDIHGSTKLSVNGIMKRHQAEFNQMAGIMHSKAGLNALDNNALISHLLVKLNADIKRENELNFVHISPIIYPDDNHTYITIDILEPGGKSNQLPYHSRPTQTLKDPDHLIENWLAYEKQGFDYFYKENKFPIYQSCSVHHCLFGFDYEPFKKYQSIFNTKVERYKFELVNILNFDKDSQKRAAAAFLLAHVKNVDELVGFLLPSISDADANVRNNVMRVLGFVLLNNPQVNLQISKIANILDFPLTTDRNKGLLILLSLSSRQERASEITQYFGKQLLVELKQRQPNNHNLSYAILKNISGKRYAERDYTSWESWIEVNHVPTS